MQINRALLVLAIVATILTTGAGTAFAMGFAPILDTTQTQESFREKTPWTKSDEGKLHTKRHRNGGHSFHRIMHSKEHGMRVHIKNALTSGDYNAYKTALEQGHKNQLQYMSETRFNQFVQVKKLTDQGKTEEAKQILKQLHENWKTLHNKDEETQVDESEI